MNMQCTMFKPILQRLQRNTRKKMDGSIISLLHYHF